MSLHDMAGVDPEKPLEQMKPGNADVSSTPHPVQNELFEDVGRKVESMRLQQASTDIATQGTSAEDQRTGTTRLLLTRIPYFREVVLMSFDCPHCHFRNSEIQSAGQIQERGCRYKFILTKKEDFSRQVIKSESSIARFVELDVEIPAGRGQITNIESLLTTILEDLEFAQPSRRSLQPEVYERIERIIRQGREMLEAKSFPVTFTLDDPAGNSSIQPSFRDGNHQYSCGEYTRSAEQNEQLMLQSQEQEAGEKMHPQYNKTMIPHLQSDMGQGLEDVQIVPDEVYSFPAGCPGCTRACVTHMKMVNIPHFQEVVIMSTVCDFCGYRSNEVKTGGAVPAQGQRITLKVDEPQDLARDILKSESCALSSPELNLSVNPGTMGGRFTTVEGLLTQVRDDLRGQIFDADEDDRTGDSMPPETRQTWNQFFEELDKAIRAEKKFTVVLEDPLASSYVQNLCAPEPDAQIVTEEYERTQEDDEDLGLNDINVEANPDGTYAAEAEDSETPPADSERQQDDKSDEHQADDL
ncbi:MAG: nucleolar zinc-finger protein [Caeruleum heppii]|nr:MAG: nucleolar zinc-finger protein [Caeruleum heppii]